MDGPKSDNEARDHHYVPRFLLRQWLVDGKLRAYWWNAYTQELRCEGNKGVGGFCFEPHLLTISEHALGRDAIETKFFRPVDERGSIVRAKIISQGITSLTGEERCDLIRLVLSLDMRRPQLVDRLRTEPAQWAKALNSDEELKQLMAKYGAAGSATDYLAAKGVKLEDRALMLIQGLVDNKKIGPQLVNAYWHIVTLGASDGTFVLSDRPLVKYSLVKPDGYWVLPIDSKHAFVLTPYKAVYEAVRSIAPRRFAKGINPQSARQANRYVFSVDPNVERWIGKHLKFGAAHPVVEDHLQ